MAWESGGGWWETKLLLLLPSWALLLALQADCFENVPPHPTPTPTPSAVLLAYTSKQARRCFRKLPGFLEP